MIIDYKATCFKFSDPLSPGDHIIPFSFTLPAKVPASMMWKKKDHHDKPKATVKYGIKAIFHKKSDNSPTKYK